MNHYPITILFHQLRNRITVLAGIGFLLATLSPVKAELGPAELERIGHRIWKNECDGKVEELTSWNTGENFASLGIGHFIWYPAGVEGPFEESFPRLISFFRQNGVKLPGWLLEVKHCPWSDKRGFDRDHTGERQKELRSLLSRTVKEQTQFIIQRLDAAAPKFEKAAGKQGAHVTRNIALLKQSAAGNFAMIDYINFKGDGLNAKERYQGEGWGLLQVLLLMKPADASSAPAAFADAAKRVLTRRVQNSPKDRGEKRWLPGWHNRCDAYAK